MTDNHDKGAFQISRSIFESKIWHESAEYLKIWIYIIGKANHKDKKYNGYSLNRGQCFVTYKELGEQIRYKIGFRNSKPRPSLVKHCMKHLMKELMITTMKEPRGVVITVLNYDRYQTLTNYEGTMNEPVKELRMNQDRLSINKNDKELKNERNNIYTPEQSSADYSYDDFLLMFNLKTGRKFRGDQKSKRQFKARTKEDKATKEEFEHVVDMAVLKLVGTEYEDNLTPELVTRVDKFQKYANAKGSPTKSDEPKTGFARPEQYVNAPQVYEEIKYEDAIQRQKDKRKRENEVFKPTTKKGTSDNKLKFGLNKNGN